MKERTTNDKINVYILCTDERAIALKANNKIVVHYYSQLASIEANKVVDLLHFVP